MKYTKTHAKELTTDTFIKYVKKKNYENCDDVEEKKKLKTSGSERRN